MQNDLEAKIARERKVLYKVLKRYAKEYVNCPECFRNTIEQKAGHVIEFGYLEMQGDYWLYYENMKEMYAKGEVE